MINKNTIPYTICQNEIEWNCIEAYKQNVDIKN